MRRPSVCRRQGQRSLSAPAGPYLSPAATSSPEIGRVMLLRHDARPPEWRIRQDGRTAPYPG
jgi:hypothetical protein